MIPNETIPPLAPSTFTVVQDNRTVDYAQVVVDLDRAEAKLRAIKEELRSKSGGPSYALGMTSKT